MKKIVFIIIALGTGITTAVSQTTLQTVTSNGGNSTTNPISITPSLTATTTNTIAPALTIMPDYIRTGPVSVITSFTVTGAKTGTYTNLSPVNTTGTGSGLTITVTADATTTTATATVVNAGTGYNVGDALTIPVTALGATGTGMYTMYIGNVNSTANYHVRHAALSFNSTIGGYSYANAVTPMFNATARFRDNSQATSSQLQFGYFFKTAQNPFWAFSVNGTYVMGISSVIDINTLAAYNATVTTLNGQLITNTNGRIVANGNSNASFIDNTSKFVGGNTNVGSSFIANQTTMSGSVISLTITSPGSGYTPGTYVVNATTSGAGTGLVLNVIVGTAGAVTNVGLGSNVTNYGSGYTQGQAVSAVIPGGSGFSATVNLRTGHHFSALANYATFKSKTADNFYTIRSIPTINQEEGATGNVYGFYHNPTLTSLKGSHIAFQNTTGDVYFGTTSGNVGIGTTNPQAKLAVKGTLLAQRVRVSVNAAEWPDYVFDSSYKLLPLPELEAFIQQNSHLPEIPSAATVGKEGLDLGDNQQLLLKKIEELTLYVIEQNKELKAQNERIKTLEATRKNKTAP